MAQILWLPEPQMVEVSRTPGPQTAQIPQPAPTPRTTNYMGPIDGPYIQVATGPEFSCMVTLRLTGTMRITLETLTEGVVTGTGEGVLTVQPTLAPGAMPPFVGDGDTARFCGSVAGAPPGLRFAQETTETVGQGLSWDRYEFAGSLEAGRITGLLTVNHDWVVQLPDGAAHVIGSSTTPVTLRR